MSANATHNRRNTRRRPVRVYNDDFDDRRYHEVVDEDESPRNGPARYHDDDYYAKNDAGEYVWM